MMKAVIIAVIALVVGWFSAPLLILFQSGDCASETLFVYDEPHRVIVSKARWFSHPYSQQFYYQANLSITPDGQPTEKVLLHRTVVTEWEIHAGSMSINTVRTFRVAGPESDDENWGRYADPMAKAGFNNRIYLFKLPGGRKAVGYRNIPISTCIKR